MAGYQFLSAPPFAYREKLWSPWLCEKIPAPPTGLNLFRKKLLFFLEKKLVPPFWPSKKHLCHHLRETAKRIHLGGMPPITPLWFIGRLSQGFGHVLRHPTGLNPDIYPKKNSVPPSSHWKEWYPPLTTQKNVGPLHRKTSPPLVKMIAHLTCLIKSDSVKRCTFWSIGVHVWFNWKVLIREQLWIIPTWEIPKLGTALPPIVWVIVLTISDSILRSLCDSMTTTSKLHRVLLLGRWGWLPDKYCMLNMSVYVCNKIYINWCQHGKKRLHSAIYQFRCRNSI